MAKVKGTLEGRLLVHERVVKVFPQGPSLNRKDPEHFVLEVKKIESGEIYDNHECIITINSHREIVHYIVTQSMISAMKQLAEPWCSECPEPNPDIISVVPEEAVYNADRTRAKIRFEVINNIEINLKP